MTRLPLTVIGGYLGAGKTTFINRLLSADHGKRLMVMVNDFGAVNVDAALIKAQGADTLELTNGCVCCTMGADLFMAVGDLLDRPERPDHLIIEASGVADPASIADVARNEPELDYAGIITVVDGLNFPALLEDAQIAPQIEAQVGAADLIYVSKSQGDVPSGLDALGAQRISTDPAVIEGLMWDIEADLPAKGHGHAHFTRWHGVPHPNLTRADLIARLNSRPTGLYRVKGFLVLDAFGMAEVQVVGKAIDIRASTYAGPQALVGIGPAATLALDEITTWWAAA